MFYNQSITSLACTIFPRGCFTVLTCSSDSAISTTDMRSHRKWLKSTKCHIRLQSFQLLFRLFEKEENMVFMRISLSRTFLALQWGPSWIQPTPSYCCHLPLEKYANWIFPAFLLTEIDAIRAIMFSEEMGDLRW